jgi:biopolymer transport protein ExbD/biopolymer transport protein TolR
VVFLAVATMLSVAPRSVAQTLQRGISVQLAPTSSAVPVPNADKQDALIITLTQEGTLFFGVEPVSAGALAEQLKARVSRGTNNLYLKADARAHYADVVKVLEAARTAGASGVTLLTGQPQATTPGTPLPPQGIEMEMARHSPATAK